jgi:hypothetical protein
MIPALGDLADVFRVLEDGGVEKFARSWPDLREAIQGEIDAATKRSQMNPALTPKRG